MQHVNTKHCGCNALKLSVVVTTVSCNVYSTLSFAYVNFNTLNVATVYVNMLTHSIAVATVSVNMFTLSVAVATVNYNTLTLSIVVTMR